MVSQVKRVPVRQPSAGETMPQQATTANCFSARVRDLVNKWLSR